MEKIRKEILDSWLNNGTYDVSTILEKLKEQEPPYPTRPKKPFLAKNGSLDEAKKYVSLLEQYVSLLEQYEIDNEEFKKVREKYVDEVNKINSLKEHCVKYFSGFYDIPLVYQDKVWSYAWEEGHSYGYYEVFLKLVRIVEIF